MATQYKSPLLNHLELCRQFLLTRNYQTVNVAGSFASYMTGLAHHTSEDKPEEHGIYLCVPEVNNPYDANAMGIYSDKNKRLAFVPKNVCAHIASSFPKQNFILTCFCTGHCTSKSAQCIYNLFQVTSASSVSPPICTVCRQVADCWILPCKHYASCIRCSGSILSKSCPKCQTIVTSFQKV